MHAGLWLWYCPCCHRGISRVLAHVCVCVEAESLHMEKSQLRLLLRTCVYRFRRAREQGFSLFLDVFRDCNQSIDRKECWLKTAKYIVSWSMNVWF